MGDITMQDYAKLRKLDDDELNQVAGGGESTGNDGYVCEQCGARCGSSIELLDHMRTHGINREETETNGGEQFKYFSPVR